MALPNFLGIGAQRSGTTWLDAKLRRHPQIYLCRRRKEVHYFDRYYDRGTDWYGQFFPTHEIGAGRTAVGEITPNYLFDREAAFRIAADFPGMRLIVLLRDPVDRAYSQFGLEIVKGRCTGTEFGTFLTRMPEAIERSRYYGQLKRYFDRFPREQMLVLIFEEVMSARFESMQSVCRFLGVDPGLVQSEQLTEKVGESRRPRFAAARKFATACSRRLRDHDLDWVINAAKGIGFESVFGDRGRVPALSPAEHAHLTELFADDITRLEQLIDRDLSIWRSPKPAT